MISSNKDKEPFDHFVCTKFNVLDESSSGKTHLGVDEGWLERRFKLFETFCLPSMVAQTNKKFQWLIFMDIATPKKFVNRLEELSSEHSYILPIYCRIPDPGEREAFFLNEIKSRSSHERIRIMTNLDNDDYIHPQMVENIQKMARLHCGSHDLNIGFFMSFPLGFSECQGDFYFQRFRYNPFASFVSDSEYNKSILGWDHTKIAGVAPILYNYSRAMWCQVIHGENVANSVRGIYWPWAKRMHWLVGKSSMNNRSFIWQCIEVWKSAKKYLLGR